MLIVGAGGFAREVLETLLFAGYSDEICFFDDRHADRMRVYDQYAVLKTKEDVKKHFSIDPAFVLGVGDPFDRKTLYTEFSALGGRAFKAISEKAILGQHQVTTGEGSYIAHGSILTCQVQLGKGCLVNLNCTIGHEVEIGEFSVLSPGVHISGGCKIGELCFFGTGAVLLPGVHIGDGVRVGAGSIVTKNLPAGCTAMGVPARVTKKNQSA